MRIYSLLNKLICKREHALGSMKDYYTHRPFLKSELSKIDYSQPVLCMEFGTGPGSAEVFIKFVDRYKNLTVVSFESDSEWHKSMKDIYESARYKFVFVYNWDNLFIDFKLELFGFDKCELAFVDQNPWQSRIDTIDALQNVTRCFILHDYDFYNKGLIQDIF